MFLVTPDDLSQPVDIDGAEEYFVYERPSASFSLMERDIRKWRRRFASPDWQIPPPPPTAVEIAAIYQYTGSGARRINPLLRGDIKIWLDSVDFRDKHAPEQLFKAKEDALLIAKLAISGLRQLPDYKGLLHRNVNFTPDELAGYQPGEFVTESAFTSTSISPSAYTRGTNTYFVIISKTGKPIQRFSKKRDEDEVLFPPGTRFRVIRKQENFKRPVTGSHVTLIVMREVGKW